MTLSPDFKHADRILKKGPIDGDGDGWVYDGTPKKRPATPAERAAGIAARAKKGAAAKNPKDPKAARIARFERAIKAAKTPQDKKRVQALIDQDFVLDKPEREALKARLNGAAAPKAAPNPKKVAAKKPEPKKDLVADPELPPSAPKKPERVPVKAAAGKKAAAPKKKLREHAAETPQVDIPNKRPEQQSVESPPERVQAAIAVMRLKKELDAVQNVDDLARFKANIPAHEKALILKHPDMLKSLNDHYKARKAELAGAADTHGLKTKAWNRLWNRDLGNAKTLRQLQRLEAQVKSLFGQNRITADEHDALMKAVQDKRDQIGGKHKRPSALRRALTPARDRQHDVRPSRTPRPADQTPNQPQGNTPKRDNGRFALREKQIDRLKNLDPKHADVELRIVNRAIDNDALLDADQKKRLKQKVEDALAEVGGRTPDVQVNGPETNAYEALAAAKDAGDVSRAEAMADEAYGRGLIDKKTRDEIHAEAAKKRAEFAVQAPADPVTDKDAETYKKRLADFDAKIADAAAKDGRQRDMALRRVISELQGDQVVNESDFGRILDAIQDVADGKSVPRKVGPRGGTVQPPADPGAGRARAAAAGGVQLPSVVQRRLDKIDAANDPYAIDRILREVGKNARINDPDHVEQIIQRAVEKLKQYDVGDGEKEADGPDGNWNAFGPPWAKPILKGSPAAKHFEKGGGLADAPDDGLFDFVMQQNGVESAGYHLNPGDEGHRGAHQHVHGLRPTYEAVDTNRFRVSRPGNAGISANYFVEELDDKGNVVAWRMFKGSNGFQKHDIENEVVASRILEQMGVEAPKAQFARNPKHKGPKWLAMENAAVLLGADYKPGDKPDLMDFSDLGNQRKLKAYRNQVLFMDMFDWFIANGDRHGGNWMVLGDGQGNYRPVIIDNGGGFQRMHDRPFSPGKSHLINSLYDGNRAEMLQDVDRILDMMDRLDVDTLMKEFLGPDNPQGYKGHLTEMQVMLKKRMAHIRKMRPEDVAREYGVR